MRTALASTIALCATAVHALQNSSPFFAFSSVPSTFTSTGPFASGSQITSALNEALRACQADAYVLVNQPHVFAEDFSSEDAAPHLRRRMTNDNQTSYPAALPEVVGQIDLEALRKTLQEKCGATVVDIDTSPIGVILRSESFPQIVNVNFPALSTSAIERASQLQNHDSFLNAVINNLHTKSFIAIYATSPPPSGSQAQQSEQDFISYESSDKFQNAMHIDLKRDLNTYVRRANNTNANVALFEKYGFLTPGIFMGGLAAILLFVILYVGVTAIASLEIPVMAFSKEMGPAAQKKQQ